VHVSVWEPYIDKSTQLDGKIDSKMTSTMTQEKYRGNEQTVRSTAQLLHCFDVLKIEMGV